MKAVILAGGSGTRLWPLSRQEYPKQFLKINNSASFLQQTVKRILPLVSEKDLVIVTNEKYKFHVISDLNEVGHGLAENLILEPVGRNTAPAIGLAAIYCKEKLGCSEDEVILVLPSDHMIKPEDKFRNYINSAVEIAKNGYLVTFGIKPTRPETGYGYIKTSKEYAVNSKQSTSAKDGKDYEAGAGQHKTRGHGPEATSYLVEQFTEKPGIETAQEYIKEGDYYWNAGIFAFTIGSILGELGRQKPGISALLQNGFDSALSSFSEMPDISIDYAVMEPAEKVAVIPMDIYWNDIGSFDSMYEIFESDNEGNVHTGDVISIEGRNSFVIGNKRLIATIGLDGMVIVETDDAVLISKKDQTQKVKEIVNKLKAKQRQEAIEHTTIYRPWGSYTVLEEGHRYKIKRIVVNPTARLSLQKHYHRSEHWVVVKGTAKVMIGDKEIFIHENESAYVPKSTLHRLENPGKVPLEIIEVQNGEYVGEDDIERVDDVYGREKK
ncbi:MAG: mannose-1-phosphate guanylyltransferase/mannose-6-phosphate isomerase [Nitrospirota bacterium]